MVNRKMYIRISRYHNAHRFVANLYRQTVNYPSGLSPLRENRVVEKKKSLIQNAMNASLPKEKEIAKYAATIC